MDKNQVAERACPKCGAQADEMYDCCEVFARIIRYAYRATASYKEGDAADAAARHILEHMRMGLPCE